MRHDFDIVVRWSDEDRLGHVNNSRYLTFAEDARLAWMHASPEGNQGLILARSEIDFRRPVHFVVGGHLEVHTQVLSIGRSSLSLRQDIVPSSDAARAGRLARTPEAVEPVAETRHVLVGFDYAKQRSRPWSDGERRWFDRWLVEAP